MRVGVVGIAIPFPFFKIGESVRARVVFQGVRVEGVEVMLVKPVVGDGRMELEGGGLWVDQLDGSRYAVENIGLGNVEGTGISLPRGRVQGFLLGGLDPGGVGRRYRAVYLHLAADPGEDVGERLGAQDEKGRHSAKKRGEAYQDELLVVFFKPLHGLNLV